MPKKRNELPAINVEMIRARLREYSGHYGTLARCSGIPRTWINQFAQGIYCDPGAGRLECLARAIGFRTTYRPVTPIFEPGAPITRALKDDAIRRAIHVAVYGASGGEQ